MRTHRRGDRPSPTSPARRAFTLFEMVTALLIMGTVINMIIVTYLRADRANTRAMLALDRLLLANRTMDHLRRTIRRAEAVLGAHGQWRSDHETLVLRAAGGRTLILTRRGQALAEIDPDRAGGKPLLRPIHVDEVHFDYGGREPAEARVVTVTLALSPVWPDTVDGLVLRTSGALRTEGRGQP